MNKFYVDCDANDYIFFKPFNECDIHLIGEHYRVYINEVVIYQSVYEDKSREFYNKLLEKIKECMISDNVYLKIRETNSEIYLNNANVKVSVERLREVH